MLSQLLYLLLFLLITVLAAALGFLWLARQRATEAVQAQALARQQEIEAACFEPPHEPIRLLSGRQGWDEDWKWAPALVIFALLAFSVESAWGRVLAWPAGLLSAALAVVAVKSSRPPKPIEVVASAEGLRLAGAEGPRSLRWDHVDQSRVVQLWSSGSSRRLTRRSQAGQRLELLDAQGHEMLVLPLPLYPASASELLLASIAVWTGRPLQHDDREV